MNYEIQKKEEPAIRVVTKVGFLKRLGYLLSNPVTYLFKGYWRI